MRIGRINMTQKNTDPELVDLRTDRFSDPEVQREKREHDPIASGNTGYLWLSAKAGF